MILHSHAGSFEIVVYKEGILETHATSLAEILDYDIHMPVQVLLQEPHCQQAVD